MKDNERRSKAVRPVAPGRGVAPPRNEVQAFLETVARTPDVVAAGGGTGRLLFALDATASRQPTWDTAAAIQAEMFAAAAGVGQIAVQVCYYRGYGEFRASPWLSDADRLVRLMGGVTCRAGRTQIRKVLRHAVNETRRQRLAAVVFVGDCMEEDVDELGAVAGELGVLGVPVFLFHEGDDPLAGFAFQQIATLTGGAACRFDAASPRTLRDLLCAVAVFAAGGRDALNRYALTAGATVARLADQTRSR